MYTYHAWQLGLQDEELWQLSLYWLPQDGVVGLGGGADGMERRGYRNDSFQRPMERVYTYMYLICSFSSTCDMRDGLDAFFPSLFSCLVKGWNEKQTNTVLGV